MICAELTAAVERLHAEGCSCVVSRGGRQRLFRQRGVLDLYRLLCEEPETLRGAVVADKVVGKAAAALLILGGVRELYADVASRPALDLLRRAGTAAACGRSTERIVNRAGTGLCPLESRCLELATPEACFERIEAFVREQSAPKNETNDQTK